MTGYLRRLAHRANTANRRTGRLGDLVAGGLFTPPRPAPKAGVESLQGHDPAAPPTTVQSEPPPGAATAAARPNHGSAGPSSAQNAQPVSASNRPAAPLAATASRQAPATRRPVDSEARRIAADQTSGPEPATADGPRGVPSRGDMPTGTAPAAGPEIQSQGSTPRPDRTAPATANADDTGLTPARPSVGPALAAASQIARMEAEAPSSRGRPPHKERQSGEPELAPGDLTMAAAPPGRATAAPARPDADLAAPGRDRPDRPAEIRPAAAPPTAIAEPAARPPAEPRVDVRIGSITLDVRAEPQPAPSPPPAPGRQRPAARPARNDPQPLRRLYVRGV